MLGREARLKTNSNPKVIRIKWPMEMAKRSGERSGEPGNSTTERRFVCRKGSRVRKSEKGPEGRSLRKLKDMRVHGLDSKQQQ